MTGRRFPEDFVERDGVFRPRSAADLIDYSDGPAVEGRLREILLASRDRRSDSAELGAAICDWPTAYHLSPQRANLLRAIALDPRARVLELGCGCGALTRYLGETVRSVVACEGSLPRAELARLRCRDLQNVQVVAGNVDDVKFPERFDVVTLIGVLEYAALYVRGEAGGDPFDRLLSVARRHLDRRGILVLAIENQLGVKYLAGCGEDHGLPRFSGVEGYPDAAGPRTFGRAELERRLAHCGFGAQALLLPFPDYKLPVTVLNAAHTAADEARRLNLVDWCRQPYEQYDGQRAHLYSDHLALAAFAADGRLAEASNSFLWIAAAEARALPRPSWAALKFNLQRRPRYRTVARLEAQASGATLHKEQQQVADAPADPRLGHAVESSCAYAPDCVSLAFRMLQALRRSREAESAFALCLAAWFEFLQQSAGGSEAQETVPGEYLDCTPDNLLIQDDTSLRYIDAEWRWAEPVPLDWLLYRGLSSFWHAHAPWVRQALRVDSAEEFVRRSAELLARPLPRGRMRELGRLERALQERVNGPGRPSAAPSPAEKGGGRRFEHAARWLREVRGVRSIALAGDAPGGWREAVLGQGIEIRPLEAAADIDLAVVFEGADQEQVLRVAQVAGELLWCPSRLADLGPEWLGTAGFAETPTDASFAAPGARLWRSSGRLRVTLVSPTSALHGGTLVIYRHATLLAERGHRVFVASVDPTPPDWVPLPPRVTFLPLSADFEASLPDADALVATLWTTARQVAAAPACKGQKFYLVQSFESLWAGEPDDIDPTYTLPLHKLCVSSWLQRQLRETFDEASSVVPNGCDYAGTVPRPAPVEGQRPLRIGMLYHEAEVKGTADGLAAFARARSELGQRASLVLFGTRRPRDPELAGIEFHERPTREELSALYRGLDVFVSPSLTEGFNLPALEALSHGVPLAMTDCGGCSDYATAETALLSPPQDPQALALNLLRLCRDPGLRARLGERGRHVAATFTWSRSADQLQTALGEQIARPTGRLKILYVAAGPVWFDTFLDPWLLRGLHSLGHEVVEFHPRPVDYRYAKRFVRPEMLDPARRRDCLSGAGSSPAELPGWVRRHRPDLVFFNHGLLVPPQVLDELTRLGVPTAVWMIDEPQELHYSANRGRLFDYVFVQDRGTLRAHRESGNPATFLMPHGVDPVDHRQPSTDTAAEDRCDVLLIGTGFPARRALVRGLARLDGDIRIVGRQWEGLAGPNLRVDNRPVAAADAGRLYRAARITLNVHRGAADMASGTGIPDPKTPNGSFFHIAACGSLQMVDRAYPGAEDYLQPDRQYVTFDSPEDLAEKITHYLDDEPARQAMARDAAAAVHGFQTYAHRLDEALRSAGRPRVRRRRFGLCPAASEDREIFALDAAVPLQSILLHSSGDLRNLQRALLGVAAGHTDPNEVVVAHPQNAELERWLDEREIRHVALTDGPHLAAACNAGRRTAQGEYLIYLGDDVLATTHLFRRLVAPMERDAAIALVAPAVHPAGGGQSMDLDYRTLHQLGGIVRRLYLENREHFADREEILPLCFAVRRRALDAVGGLDERDPGRSLDDLCLRLRREGWRTGWTRTTLVHRLGPAAAAP